MLLKMMKYSNPTSGNQNIGSPKPVNWVAQKVQAICSNLFNIESFSKIPSLVGRVTVGILAIICFAALTAITLGSILSIFSTRTTNNHNRCAGADMFGLLFEWIRYP